MLGCPITVPPTVKGCPTATESDKKGCSTDAESVREGRETDSHTEWLYIERNQPFTTNKDSLWQDQIIRLQLLRL
jgi:hypothetical protein